MCFFLFFFNHQLFFFMFGVKQHFFACFIRSFQLGNLAFSLCQFHRGTFFLLHKLRGMFRFHSCRFVCYVQTIGDGNGVILFNFHCQCVCRILLLCQGLFVLLGQTNSIAFCCLHLNVVLFSKSDLFRVGLQLQLFFFFDQDQTFPFLFLEQ